MKILKIAGLVLCIGIVAATAGCESKGSNEATNNQDLVNVWKAVYDPILVEAGVSYPYSNYLKITSTGISGYQKYASAPSPLVSGSVYHYNENTITVSGNTITQSDGNVYTYSISGDTLSLSTPSGSSRYTLASDSDIAGSLEILSVTGLENVWHITENKDASGAQTQWALRSSNNVSYHQYLKISGGSVKTYIKVTTSTNANYIYGTLYHISSCDDTYTISGDKITWASGNTLESCSISVSGSTKSARFQLADKSSYSASTVTDPGISSATDVATLP